MSTDQPDTPEHPCAHMDKLAEVSRKKPYETTWKLEERPMMVADHAAHMWDEMSVEDRAAMIATDYVSAICWEGGPAALASFLRWTYEGVYGGKDWEGEDDRRFRACLDGAEGKQTDTDTIELLRHYKERSDRQALRLQQCELGLESARPALRQAVQVLADLADHLVPAVTGKRMRVQLGAYLTIAQRDLAEVGGCIAPPPDAVEDTDSPPF